MWPLEKPEHEAFAQRVARAIRSESIREYDTAMAPGGNPLRRPDIVRGEITAIHARVHWLVENGGD